MTRSLFCVVALVLSMQLQAQHTLSEGASLLFKNTKSSVTASEKNNVYKQLNFLLSKDKKQFVDPSDENKEYPFEAFVFITDLNKDKLEEIFVSYGNTYTSGNTGSSIVLFIKDAAGNYKSHLGFPGLTPDALTTMSNGYPDLLIGGPGLQFPVWRWNGKVYNFFRNVKDADYSKMKKTNIEELSKQYQSGLR